jgi:glycosyltransferase involved in cell wall biosynthesis
MKKKKICICASQVPFVHGGAELHVQALYNELVKRGYNTEIVQLPYKWYPREQIINTIFAWNMIDLTESNNEKIDLVIPTKFPSYMVHHENKVVWLIHQFRQIYDQYGTRYSDFTEADEPIRQLIIKEDNRALGEAKKIFTNAQNTANRLQKYNGIQGEALYHPPMHYGKYYHENYGDYILSVGRLDDAKRIDLMIRAAKYTGKNVRFLIAGTGPMREKLEKLAIEEGVEDRVEFLGFVEDNDLLRLYANARGIFFAPYDEDYGYITLEAFLSKKPVITTVDAGGVLEFVRDGENGFINELNVEALGESINKLFSTSSISQDFGNAGFDLVKDISWDNVIDRLTETIR